jgi:two-component system LytT family response regulator
MKETILIADDEPLARRTLREHLRDLGCEGQICEARDGKATIALANKERPQLVFLDIVMPGASGLDVLEQLDYGPKVIFTTAHDQYAVTAFELGALDYVLKPFSKTRLERALQRAQVAVADPAGSALSRAKEVLGPARPISRIFVRDGTRIVPIALAAIERVQGADDFARIFALPKQYLVGIRLSDLETHLVPANFLRIHRSHLINLEYVTSIEPYDANRVEVVMRSGARVVASRAGSKRLRDLAV